MPKNIKGSGRKEKLNLKWVRNVATSTGSVMTDIMKDMAPASVDFSTGMAEQSKELFNVIKKSRQSMQQMDSKTTSLKYIDMAKSYKRNLMQNIKTGDFKQKLGDGFDDFEDFDFGDDDFGLDDIDIDGTDVDLDDGESDRDIEIAQVTTKATVAAVGKSSKLVAQAIADQTNATIASSVAAEQSARQASVVNMQLLNSINSNLVSGFTSMNDNLKLLVEFNSSTMSTLASAILGNMENQAKQADSDKMINTAKNIRGGYTKNVSKAQAERDKLMKEIVSYGDIGAYGKLLKGNIENFSDSNMVISMLKTVLEDDDMVGDVINNPLNYLMKGRVNKLFSEKVKNKISDVDRGVGAVIPALMSRMADNKNSSNMFLEAFGEIFGGDVKVKKTINKGGWSNGAMEWNGEAHKTLVDVIPFYLRKMTAALTGEEEMVYDGNTNRFKRFSKAKADFQKEVDRKAISGYDMYDIEDGLSAFSFKNYADRREFKSKIEKVLKGMTDSRTGFNPRFLFEKEGQTEKDREYAQNFEDLLTENDMDDNESVLFKALIKNMGKSKAANLFSKGRLESQIALNDFFRGFEKDDPNRLLASMIFGEEDVKYNTHLKKNSNYNPAKHDSKYQYAGAKAGSIIGGALDSYGFSNLDYLRDIRNILANGIEVVVSGGHLDYLPGGAPPTGPGGGTTPLLDGLGKFRTNSIATKKKKQHDNQAATVDMNRREATDAEIESARTRSTMLLDGFDDLSGFTEDDLAELMRMERNKYEDEDKIGFIEKQISKMPDSPLKQTLMQRFAKVRELKQDTSGKIMGGANIVEDVLFEVMYGSPKSALEKMTKGKTGNDYSAKFKAFLTGKLYKGKSGEFYGGDEDESLFGTIKNMGKYAADSVAVKLLGTGNSIFGGGDNSGATPAGTVGGLVGRMHDSITDVSGTMMETLFGADFSGIDVTSKKDAIQKHMIDYTEKFKKMLPKSVAGGVVGGVLGAGGIGLIPSLFLPGGPITGALLGAGIGMAAQSNSLSEYLFGKRDENGEFKGKYFSKDTANWLDKNKKTFIGGGVLGAGLSLTGITSVGFLPSLFLGGGPIGAAIMGIGTSMVMKSQEAQDFLFGRMDDAGKYVGGLFSSIKNKLTEATGKEDRAGLSKILSGVAGGAGASMLLGNFGLLGGMMTLGGSPLLGAGLGLSMALKTRGTSWMDMLFGKEDENGKREGGALSNALQKAQIDMLLPLKTRISEATQDSKDWFMKTIGLPIKLAFAPVVDTLTGTFTRFGDWMSRKKRGAQDFISKLFKEHIGDPTTSFAKKMFGGAFNIVKGISKSILSVGKGAGAVAGGLISGVGNIGSTINGRRDLKDFRRGNKEKNKLSNLANKYSKGKLSDEKFRANVYKITGERFTDAEWEDYRDELVNADRYTFQDRMSDNYGDNEQVNALRFGKKFANVRAVRKSQLQAERDLYDESQADRRAKIAEAKEQDAMRSEMAKKFGYKKKDGDGNQLDWLYDPRTKFSRDENGEIKYETHQEKQEETKVVAMTEIRTETVEQTSILKDIREVMTNILVSQTGGKLPDNVLDQYRQNTGAKVEEKTSKTAVPKTTVAAKGVVTDANMTAEEKKEKRKKHAEEQAKVAEKVRAENAEKQEAEKQAKAEREAVSVKDVDYVQAEIAAEEETEKKEGFASKLLSAIKEGNNDRKEHQSLWSKMFGNKGLLTVGLLGLGMAIPGIVKTVKGLFDKDENGEYRNPEVDRTMDTVKDRSKRLVANVAAKILTPVDRLLGAGARQASKHIAKKKAAKEAATIAADKAAKEASEKAAKEASEKAAKETAEIAAKKAAKEEAAKKAAKETAAKKATKEAAEESVEKGTKEAVGKAAKKGVASSTDEAVTFAMSIKKHFINAIETVMSSKPVRMFLGKEVAEKTSKELIEQAGKAITEKAAKELAPKILAKMGELGLHAVGSLGGPIKLGIDVVFGAIDFFTGLTKTETAGFFEIAQSEVSMSMRVIAAIVKTICGFGIIGPVFDIIDEFIYVGLGVSGKRWLCEVIYKGFASQKSETKLDVAQEEFRKKAEQEGKTVSAYSAEVNRSYFDKTLNVTGPATTTKYSSDSKEKPKTSAYTSNNSSNVNPVTGITTIHKPTSTSGPQSSLGASGSPMASQNGGKGGGAVPTKEGCVTGCGPNGFTFYSQQDAQWANNDYSVSGGANTNRSQDTLANKGCGVTSMAMVASQLTGQQITPDQVAQYSQNNGYSVQSGTSWTMFGKGATALGVNSKDLGQISAQQLMNVSSDKPMILAGRGGAPFTDQGHFITAVGYDPTTNEVLVNDPLGGPSRYTPDQLASFTRNAWMYSKQGQALTSSVSGRIDPRGGRGPFMTNVLQNMINQAGGTSTTSGATVNNTTSTTAGGNTIESGKADTKKTSSGVNAGDEIVKAAKSHLGCPYVWGGTGEVVSKESIGKLRTRFPGDAKKYDAIPSSFYNGSTKGFDCSGLVVYTHKEVGITVNGRTTNDFVNLGKEVSQAEALPGDIVLCEYSGENPAHVGIYIGNNRMIHASKPGDVVKESGLWSAKNVFRRLHTGSATAFTGSSNAGATVAGGPTPSGSPLAFIGSKMLEIFGNASSAMLTGKEYQNVNVDYNNQGTTEGGGASSGGFVGTGAKMNGMVIPAGMKVGTAQLGDAYNKYKDVFVKYSNEYGVDPDLMMALSRQESGGDPNSYNGYARGLMQIEYTNTDDFVKYGKEKFGQSWSQQDMFDPNKAIPYGIKRVAGHMGDYNNDEMKALQSYNFGGGAFNAVMRLYGKEKGVDPKSLTDETDQGWIKYVDEVHRNPKKHVQASWAHGTYGDAKYLEHVLRYYHPGKSTGGTQQVSQNGGMGGGSKPSARNFNVPSSSRRQQPASPRRGMSVSQNGGFGGMSIGNSQTVEREMLSAARGITSEPNKMAFGSSGTDRLLSQAVTLLKSIADSGVKTVGAINNLDITPVVNNQPVVAPIIKDNYAENKRKDEKLSQKQKRYSQAMKIAMGA